MDGSKPITKNEACDILNISYNTTRLQKIIDDHEEHKAYTKKRKASLRGRPASNAEIATACTDFLQGDTVSDIAKRLFRSTGFVKNILAKVGIPERPSNREERLAPHYYPDECLSEDYSVGEIAWSAQYHAPVKILRELTSKYMEDKPGLVDIDYEKSYMCPCYQVYIREKTDSENTYFANITDGGFNAYVPAYELCKLEHLIKYGVNLDRI